MLNITSLIFYNFLNMRTKSKHRQEALKKSLSQLLQIQKKHLPLQPQSREIATIKWNDGALVQLVRIHACHAWGHGFESRTHRNNTLKPLKVIDFQGLFSWGLNRETNLMTHRDAFWYIAVCCINRKTSCNAFPNRLVSILHLLIQE